MGVAAAPLERRPALSVSRFTHAQCSLHTMCSHHVNVLATRHVSPISFVSAPILSEDETTAGGSTSRGDDGLFVPNLRALIKDSLAEVIRDNPTLLRPPPSEEVSVGW